ncbi:MAG: hypothetical protein Q6373_024400 [Candidatus Sigynarchaeota archaeon]
MFGSDFNFDGIKEKLADLKDKVKISKKADCVIVRFTDPALAGDPTTANLFSPDKIAELKAMMPDSGIPDFEFEPLEDGFKLKTKDPAGLFDMVSKMLDPDFLLDLLKQVMELFTKGMGDLFGQLGNMQGDDATGENNGPEDDDSSPGDDDPDLS